MKISDNVYQIKIDFQVAKGIRRFVYVYLITGENCYLIDSGVAGSEKEIESYMNKLGLDWLKRKMGWEFPCENPLFRKTVDCVQRRNLCKR